ncbi:MAG TPA: VOC family protein [Pyrinomonadaceae bacterium]|jgi:catechol 2,3-dioxygenase-like lactoylglutathione lyase family enzyme
MSVKLNHLIVHSRNKKVSADFLSDILGLPEPTKFGFFLTVQLDNEVTLDFIETEDNFLRTHYAFLVSEVAFDEIFSRIRERQLPFWADPYHRQEHQINKNDDGRGLYFEDPDGHNLEIITRPYGSGK